MSTRTLLVATRNPGKTREYRELLADYSGHIISLDDAGVPDVVEETGDTFQANAILKASTYAQLSGHLTISDDSGLEVHALGGAPGVYSARYGGDACQTDEDRVALLLRNLAEIPRERRIARFRCFTAVADPSDGAEPRVSTVVGSIAGVIQYEPVGEHGFGYDPVFYLPSFRATMAQLPVPAKNAISHRADAARRARLILAAL
jgi:XTP/dITP diphosphohydrolase